MDLALTEFQDILRQTAHDFAQREFPIKRHRELVESKAGFDAETWKKMAGLGWPGLLISEQYGGGGGGWVDLMVLLEEMGKALMPFTYLAHVLAGQIIEHYGTESQRQTLLPAAAGGDRVLAVALIEPRGTLDEAGVQCRIEPAAGGATLTGTKHFVRGAAAADTLLVVARAGDGLRIAVVDKSAAGITITQLDVIGDDDQARIDFAGTPVAAELLLGAAVLPWTALEEIVSIAALIECGYGIGVMARDTEITINYVKDRVQFGRPIGSFQAVHHQVADQVTDVDCGRLLTLYAASAADEESEETATDIARAKAWVSDALRRVARTGNQLHGGIGFSREYDIHLFYQRAKTSELMYGIADDHRERIAAALLD